ncbi:MAG TPA: DMT family transporter [Spirochaetia bacterium]|nr:DMT family transporter [Spirochaetia bacterium]
MAIDRIGELAALGTAMCWTLTAVVFEWAGKRVGSLAVNLIRLVLAFFYLAVYSFLLRGQFVPLDAGANAWVWLSLSGLVGFVVGDLFLFQAFVLVGSRISMLVYSVVPPLTAVLGWLILGERLSAIAILGMVLTISGIAVVVLQRSAEGTPRLDAVAARVPHSPPAGPSVVAAAQLQTGRAALAHPLKGILYAFGGALGQAGGLVLSKLGAPTFDPFGATQIRGIAGIVGFTLIFAATRRWREVATAVRHRPAMWRIAIGAFFGPFLGVSLGLLAAQRTTTGIASTIMSLVPVFIIVPAVVLFHERVTFREILGAVVAVGGVALLFF